MVEAGGIGEGGRATAGEDMDGAMADCGGGGGGSGSNMTGRGRIILISLKIERILFYYLWCSSP
jgi:hypothetical protein